ncbi:hypothetical protein [Secundilactobacillus folii]|uniref:DUF2187 domain-containing protein n=1 Tax=Secundilactobacillus folii TaxID=2678357 RepID=A0A7X2XXD9_9LACO|nr:hypothetical protein [Secundilactobacillus folii]MTV83328.1 hypothetical protein [Secundilactobacillus folii]
MSEALKFQPGRLVRCQHPAMRESFIGRVCQVYGNRLVVEVMNYNFRDRRVVEANRYQLVVDAVDAKTMTIIRCHTRKG